MGYSETILAPMQRAYILTIVPRDKVKFKWAMNEFGKLYRMGFKRCGKCNFMIKIDGYNCPICNRKMKRTMGKKMK